MSHPFPAAAATAAALLLAGCADGPDPWTAYAAAAADVAAGGETLVQSHSRLGPDCAALPAPQIAVTEPPALGAVEVAQGSMTVEVPSEIARQELDAEALREAAPCAGVSVPTTEVRYVAGAASGLDGFTYVELQEGASPDRVWDVSVRVR